MSAQRASETPSTASSLARDLVASLRTVHLPGSPATYANRAVLREMGLRWDPANHRWHGTATAEAVKTLRERLHLEVRVFGVLEGAPKGTAAPKPASDPTPRPHDQSPHDAARTRAEARTVYRADEDRGMNSRFSEWDITSGLPDDSREEDERQEERRLRDLRGRVKAARAVVSATPGLAEILAGDWRKAGRFYAKCGVTEGMFRRGVSSSASVADIDHSAPVTRDLG